MYIFLAVVVLVIVIAFAVRANGRIEDSCCKEVVLAAAPQIKPVCVVTKKVAAKKTVKKAVKKVK
jgi:hypothetical protein